MEKLASKPAGSAMRRTACQAAVLAVALALGACQTLPLPALVAPPVQPREFQPATALSRLHFEAGPYPDLFAPSSYALWVDEAVTALRREAAIESGETIAPEEESMAATITHDYVIVECHLDSAFADMSVAYDVVGHRGLSLHLEAPDGGKIPPIQTLIGPDVRETPRGALKLFGRTNLVIFSKRDLQLETAAPAQNTATFRLVIEGHNSTFYFA